MNFIVHFAIDNEYVVVEKDLMTLPQEFDDLNIQGWRDYIQGGGTIPMVNCVYDDHVYEGTIVHVSHDSCEDVLRKIRRIVETKHSSLSTILSIIPRVQQRRNCVPPLSVSYLFVMCIVVNIK